MIMGTRNEINKTIVSLHWRWLDNESERVFNETQENDQITSQEPMKFTQYGEVNVVIASAINQD